jgi:hypothetical protein
MRHPTIFSILPPLLAGVDPILIADTVFLFGAERQID